jgi:hypothetical protein
MAATQKIPEGQRDELVQEVKDAVLSELEEDGDTTRREVLQAGGIGAAGLFSFFLGTQNDGAEAAPSVDGNISAGNVNLQDFDIYQNGSQLVIRDTANDVTVRFGAGAFDTGTNTRRSADESTLTDGSSLDSPQDVYRGYYDSDDTSGVNPTTADASVEHDVNNDGTSTLGFDVQGTRLLNLLSGGPLELPNSGLRISTGQAIEDGSGTRRVQLLDSTRTIIFNGGGEVAFDADSGVGHGIKAYSTSPFFIEDNEGDFNAVQYDTSASAPGKLDLTSATARFGASPSSPIGGNAGHIYSGGNLNNTQFGDLIIELRSDGNPNRTVTFVSEGEKIAELDDNGNLTLEGSVTENASLPSV